MRRCGLRWARTQTLGISEVSELAVRLRERRLYKCVDIGDNFDHAESLYRRFGYELQRRPEEWHARLL